MKDLEVMMINTISSAFETISTVEQGVELLDIFMHLQVREVNYTRCRGCPTCEHNRTHALLSYHELATLRHMSLREAL